MGKKTFVSVLLTLTAFSGLYAQKLKSSTDISSTDNSIVAWANGAEVYGTQSVTAGYYYNAVGQATSSKHVTLAASSQVTVTFDRPIKDGQGNDFAVFANNSSSITAKVEVSSDGKNFFEFSSLTGTQSAGYGTLYDIDDLDDDSALDKNNIRFVRIKTTAAGFNFAGVGVMNAGGKYTVADMEGLLSAANSYEIVGSSVSGASLSNQTDDYGMSMYVKNYVSGGLIFQGLAVYGGSMAIGFGPSNITNTSSATGNGYGASYYASSALAGAEGQGKGYLQAYYSEWNTAASTQHSLVMRSDTSAFYPMGVYVCNSMSSYGYSGSTNDGQPGYHQVLAIGYDASGNVTDTAKAYLINNSTFGNAKDWRYMDLTPLKQVTKIKFILKTNYSSQFGMDIPAYFCVDNLTYLDQLPVECDAPANLACTDTTSNSATIKWTGEAEKYNVKLGLDGTVNEVEDTVYTFSELQQDSLYTVYVQSVCEDDNSQWVSLQFKTLQAEDPCSETLQSELYDTICQGTQWEYNGEVYTHGGEYTVVLQTEAGCDSTVTIYLHENPTVQTDVYDTIAEGDSYTFGELTLSEAGVYTQTLESTLTGCDSTVTLYLAVKTNALSDAEALLSANIYPNPAKDYVQIRINGVRGMLQITVTDLNAREVLKQNISNAEQEIVFDVKHLAAGVYYLRIEGENILKTEKLVIK